jgi:hypothetical protein
LWHFSSALLLWGAVFGMHNEGEAGRVFSDLSANHLAALRVRMVRLAKSRKHLSSVAAIAALVITLLAAVLPYFMRNRVTPAANVCVNNLRQIEGAKQQWVLENGKTTNDTPTWTALLPYLGRGVEGQAPKCSEGGIYTLGRVGEKPRCSIGRPPHSLPK